jgi:transposase
MSIDDSLPTDLASAHALIMAQREALLAAQARATAAENEAQYRALLIEKLKYTIRKLRHERFGPSSERGALLEQLELQHGWHNVAADVHKRSGGVVSVVSQCSIGIPEGMV